MDALDVLCAQLTRDLSVIAKFLLIDVLLHIKLTSCKLIVASNVILATVT